LRLTTAAKTISWDMPIVALGPAATAIWIGPPSADGEIRRVTSRQNALTVRVVSWTVCLQPSVTAEIGFHVRTYTRLAGRVGTGAIPMRPAPSTMSGVTVMVSVWSPRRMVIGVGWPGL